VAQARRVAVKGTTAFLKQPVWSMLDVKKHIVTDEDG